MTLQLIGYLWRDSSLIFMGSKRCGQKHSHKTQLLMSYSGNFLLSYTYYPQHWHSYNCQALFWAKQPAWLVISYSRRHSEKRERGREPPAAQLHQVIAEQLNLAVGCYFPWELWFVLTQSYRRPNQRNLIYLVGTEGEGSHCVLWALSCQDHSLWEAEMSSGFFSSFPKCWNPSRSWNTAANCAWPRLGHGMAVGSCRYTAAQQK